MWMKTAVFFFLLVASVSSDASSSKENVVRQVVHPPVSEEQHADAAAETKELSSRKPLSELDLSFYHGFLASLSVIIVSELGDKTWFIAVIMAMRHSRLTVFSGAMTALALMTVLSACLGWVTQLIPRKVTYYVSTALFALFGLKMLHEGYHMSASGGQATGVISGGILGHALCTGIAVIGGKFIAQKISVRTVTIVGGVVFLIFALSTFFINDLDEKPLMVE
ncbi:hypothetical protein OESDEN_08950 [Oesophagostomum dentatum]|uniref:GDT1 family protein n=1 Tax=Oesophagostomum dentatum TaxID=61180 RepID=A0A0B1T753_OESDE|nr:hypothetical protein OESDEN_08950 [Oesophagostomum dentatum]